MLVDTLRRWMRVLDLMFFSPVIFDAGATDVLCGEVRVNELCVKRVRLYVCKKEEREKREELSQ